MFADVWSKRDFIAAGVAVVAFVLIALGQALGWDAVAVVGFIIMLAASVVLIVWRVVGGPDGRNRPDGV